MLTVAIGIAGKTLFAEELTQQAITQWIEGFKTDPLMPAWTIGAFVVGGLIGVPLNLILVSCALALGAWSALAFGIIGAELCALAGFGLGRLAGTKFLRRWMGDRLNQWSKKLEDQGILAVAVARMIPFAPFSVVNLVAGASHLRFQP